jgi:hypothetical protein
VGNLWWKLLLSAVFALQASGASAEKLCNYNNPASPEYCTNADLNEQKARFRSVNDAYTANMTSDVDRRWRDTLLDQMRPRLTTCGNNVAQVIGCELDVYRRASDILQGRLDQRSQAPAQLAVGEQPPAPTNDQASESTQSEPVSWSRTDINSISDAAANAADYEDQNKIQNSAHEYNRGIIIFFEAIAESIVPSALLIGFAIFYKKYSQSVLGMIFGGNSEIPKIDGGDQFNIKIESSFIESLNSKQMKIRDRCIESSISQRKKNDLKVSLIFYATAFTILSCYFLNPLVQILEVLGSIGDIFNYSSVLSQLMVALVALFSGIKFGVFQTTKDCAVRLGVSLGEGAEVRNQSLFVKEAKKLNCSSCQSPFAIEEVRRTKTLVTAVPRSSVSSSEGRTNSGSSDGSWRTYVDVKTTTWTEEMYNITIETQCVVCRYKNSSMHSVTEQRNRRSGTERKYY